jgi:uncharacterized membrane protein YjjP (DUF1212 family)
MAGPHREPESPRGPPHDDAVSFILDLGRALQQYGTPAHQVEATLTALCKKVGRHGEFFSTPTSLMAMIERQPGAESIAHLVRVDVGAVQLDKLSLVDEIAERVVSGTLTLADAGRQIKEVDAAPSPYGALLRLPAYGLASAAVALSFGGGWLEMAAGGAVGVLVGIVSSLLGRHVRHVFEFFASFVASAAAIAAAHWVGAKPAITTLAGLITLVPGFSLTIGVSELARRELVSGTARLMWALTVLLEMGIGAMLARQLLPASPVLSVHEGVPSWVSELALIGPVFAFVVLFQVPRNAIATVAVVCAVGFYGARLGAKLTNPMIGPWLGAFCIGIACSFYARAFNRPATIPLVPAVVLLVPGATSLNGLTAIMDAQMDIGIQNVAGGFVIAASIVVGLLTSNVIAPPRRIL